MSKIFEVNKAINLYKRLFKIDQVLKQSPGTRLSITLWAEKEVINEVKLITKVELKKRLRFRKNKIKRQIKNLEKKYSKNKMNQIKAIAMEELKKWG